MLKEPDKSGSFFLLSVSKETYDKIVSKVLTKGNIYAILIVAKETNV